MKKIFVLLFITVVCVLLSIFIIKNNINSVNTSTEVKIKQDKKTVIIDAGHGGFDGGAVTDDGTPEKDINLKIALYLDEELKKLGFKTVLTRNEDTSLESDGLNTTRQKKTSDIHNRLSLADSYNNALLISVHQNHFTDSKYHGCQMFYSPGNSEQSSILAQTLQTSVISEVQPDNTRQIKECSSSVYLIYHSKNPAVLAECGFLSNSLEAENLKNNEYQMKIAKALAKGIAEYCENEI